MSRQPAVCLSDYKGYLAVGLQTYKSIYYMAACFFKLLCPNDIVFLIKSGF